MPEPASQNIDYMLNRSTGGGETWELNGSYEGIVVANADSTQPRPNFCTVNAVLDGADQAAVDRQTGDVFYVYGNRDPVTGNNRRAVRRLSDNKHGGLAIGPERYHRHLLLHNVTASRSTGLRFLRLISASAPTKGSLTRLKRSRRQPRTTAIQDNGRSAITCK
jgi:hypothetical protein